MKLLPRALRDVFVTSNHSLRPQRPVRTTQHPNAELIEIADAFWAAEARSYTAEGLARAQGRLQDFAVAAEAYDTAQECRLAAMTAMCATTLEGLRARARAVFAYKPAAMLAADAELDGEIETRLRWLLLRDLAGGEAIQEGGR